MRVCRAAAVIANPLVFDSGSNPLAIRIRNANYHRQHRGRRVGEAAIQNKCEGATVPTRAWRTQTWFAALRTRCVVLISLPCVFTSTYLSALQIRSPDFPVTSSLIPLVLHICPRPCDPLQVPDRVQTNKIVL